MSKKYKNDLSKIDESAVSQDMTVVHQLQDDLQKLREEHQKKEIEIQNLHSHELNIKDSENDLL